MEGLAVCSPLVLRNSSAVTSSCVVNAQRTGKIGRACGQAAFSRQNRLPANSFLGLRRDGKLQSSIDFKLKTGLAPVYGEGRYPRRFLQSARAALTSDQGQQQGLFGREKELTGAANIVKTLSPPARYALCALIILTAIGSGVALGSKIRPPLGQLVGAVVLGAAGAFGAHVLNSSSKEAAAAELHNFLVNHSDFSTLRPDDVAAIAQK